MERLVVFLDNEIYGGSERLMYTVLTSKLIRENYIVNALYGYNKPMHDGLVRDYGDRYDSIFTSAPIYCNELYHVGFKEALFYSLIIHMHHAFPM